MTLGQKIQNLRKEKGLSQEDLASQITVSRQAVSKWELDLTVCGKVKMDSCGS